MPLCRLSVSVPLGPLVDTLSFVIDTVTPLGISSGLRPIRDMTHQTSQRTSPPTPLLRASLSVITPCDVLRIAMPRPLRTRGTCLAGTYARWPGRDTRRMPVIALPDADARPS